MKSFSSLLGCLWLAVCAAGCFVPDLADNAVFSCAQDTDCAAEGIVCAPRTGASGYCCKPTAEVCNNADDNCNGVRDDLTPVSCYGGPEGTQDVGRCQAGVTACANGALTCVGEVRPATAEACNDVDDDCDGLKDEDFDLQKDPLNCGACGNVCNTAIEQCLAGKCSRPMETVCEGGVDEDGDGYTDCADIDCDKMSCGAGCQCINLKRGEGLCDDGVDNDGDMDVDCVDQDCINRSCGTGCVCGGYKRTETLCGDGVDNDGDGAIDCADSDCSTQTCGTGCVCQGSKPVEFACTDTLDNDRDNAADCGDTDCAGKSCSIAPATGCTCAGLKKTEDATACNDTLDNDGDGPVDCADSDCNGKSCSVSPATGCVCASGTKTEASTACADGLDNDGDGKTDCVDTPDCNNRACGTGCVCGSGSTAGTRTENLCNDGKDNDGDMKIDCADTPDCNGKACNKTGGGTGTCSAGACN